MLWWMMAVVSCGDPKDGYGPGLRGCNAALWEAGVCHPWGACNGWWGSAWSIEKPKNSTGCTGINTGGGEEKKKRTDLFLTK